MLTHNLVQGSPEWAEFRLHHHGASEAAAMLGLSSKVTRSELLRMKHTGQPQEFSDWVRKNILDYGHEVEALARPMIEDIIGEELYPVTCSDGLLSASCDGLTMLGDTAFEHKQWNKELARQVADGVVPDEYMPQCQQIMMVTGASRVLFTVSDGTPDRLVYTEVLPDEAWFARIRAGWAQFEQDLAQYTPPVPEAEAVGRTPESLPALRIEVTGAVTASNLEKFREHALAVFDGIKTVLETDEDFATAEKTAKWCKEVEDRLDAAKQSALAQTASIEELFRMVDDLKEIARQKRLTLEKLVKARKESIRIERVEAAKAAFAEHLQGLQREISGVTLVAACPDFYGAIKGLKTLESLDNAISTSLANGKIAANEIAADVRAKLAWVDENAAEHRALLADMQQLIAKPMEDFTLAVTSRIEQFKRAEAERSAAIQQAKAEAAARPVPAAVVPAQRTLEHETPEGQPTLRLGEINERLAPITLSVAGLASMGFQPAATEKAAKLYHESDFPRICAAIIQLVQQAGERQNKAA